ncbi:MAG: adenylate/guanylate cyclase domain-containing protein [Stellaceae bacterium]
MADEGAQRRLVAVLAADVAGYSRLAGADEERTLARLRALRGDLIDPAIAAHHGRTVKRAGDGAIIEFRSVIDAVRCAMEVQTGMAERNEGVAAERQIRFRIGIHIGDVVGEADGDLMGDGVNIAARLEGIAEPDGIFLSEDAYRQIRDRMGEAFTDLGDQELKNIARPMRVYAIADAAPHQAALRAASPPPASGGRLGGGPAVEQGPPRLSIVVLPFANIGGDPEQEYFVDGVTESLTTDLSRIAGSFVIARNTAFSYKGKSPNVRDVGHDLGVRYVLEGSVQRGGNRLRVNVQLIETETGKHLWAERFDKPVADLFDMQDEIVARLANQLNTELIAAEARRAERAPDPDSMGLNFQGMAWFNKGASPDHIARALDYFERALALDPENVVASAGAGTMHLVIGQAFGGVSRSAHLAAAETALTRALSLAPNHAVSQNWLGVLYIFTGRIEAGIDTLKNAIAIDRNLASAHAYVGLGTLLLGRAEETEAHVQEALRLSPRDSLTYHWIQIAGSAKAHAGQYEEAAAWLRRSIEANRNYPIARFHLAAVYLALLDRLIEGERLAGVPEG